MKECAVIILSVIIFSVCLFYSINNITANVAATFEPVGLSTEIKTVILDAGHGGEDGGAVASDGTQEKDINLSIVNKIATLFDIFDIDYILTRNSDCSIGDNSLDTIRKRKNSDILKRFEIVNKTPGSLLLSIHQNTFSVEKYFGTQVFFAPGSKDSKDLALSLQHKIADNLQTDNKRKIKESNKSIYLLYNASRPSVMIECGFLSNYNELSKLKNDQYQCQLAYFITSGLLEFLNFQKENAYG